MTFVRSCIAAFAVFVLAHGHARASSLQISPVLVDLSGPASAEKVTLRNLGGKPINAQIRVFKWTQSGGKDVLEPTRDVVASPPMASIDANGEQIVRIVRVDKSPISTEVSYRLLVDQIPDQSKASHSAVNFMMRYSVPVFFSPVRQRSPELTWRLEQRKGVAVLIATNSGSRRVRIAELGLSSQSGTTVASRKGLVGYVLGRSTAAWDLPGVNLRHGASVSITAQGDDGTIRATATTR